MLEMIIGVRVFILDESERILLVKHSYESEEFWVIPGGGVEAGELTRDSGIREVKEETGLDVEIVRLLWTVEEISDKGMSYVNYFLGKIVGGKLALGGDPELSIDKQVLSDIDFFSREEVKELPVVYPEVLLGGFWDLLEEGTFNQNVWRQRPSVGFGIKE
ncbi:NUDIX domain-containing protein [Clostridium cellulovorans]|uniref:NUDIX hydrolase n=1 Tax=Clostridium cellulovorans (strain ATCC 35296 / DSM 3052 / OCM 3 / 743B) TaxID=573061 RepID=D9SPM1_CLOC7|nr:NUDIX hydrolase [Clostridium cellulovorans]ADL50070.1 NUDIX hydrolase [Clostridium cellulovorans 743B]